MTRALEGFVGVPVRLPSRDLRGFRVSSGLRVFGAQASRFRVEGSRVMFSALFGL